MPSSLPNPPAFPLDLDLTAEPEPAPTFKTALPSDTDSDSTTASAIDPDDLQHIRRTNGDKPQTATNDNQKRAEPADPAPILPPTTTDANADADADLSKPTPPTPFPCILLLALPPPHPDPTPILEILLLDPLTTTMPGLRAAVTHLLRTSPNISPADRDRVRSEGLVVGVLAVDLDAGPWWGWGVGKMEGKEGKEEGRGKMREGRGEKEGKEGKEGMWGNVRKGDGGKKGMWGNIKKGDGKGGRRVEMHEGNLGACLMVLGRGGGGLVVEFCAGEMGG